MNADQMSQQIIDCVRSRPGATFVEILQACGEEARGRHQLTMGETIVLWDGVSALFTDAFNIVKNKLEPRSGEQAVLCYLCDGAALSLPVINHRAKKPPKKVGWLPLTFSLKRETAKQP